MNDYENYDAIVVGAGHAGSEAGLALARLGHKTLVLSINLEAVGFLACNPSIGGSAKGHLVCEMDALGGQMGRSADHTLLQIKMLNVGKGPAVHSLRAQVDKVEYHKFTKKTLEEQDNLFLKQGEAKEILVENGKIVGLTTASDECFKCKTLIICSGVYLKARIITGDYIQEVGPNGFKQASYLSNSLQKLGFELRRFKTGTPPRIDARTIDFDKLDIQYGDDNIQSFSSLTKDKLKNIRPCYLVYTNSESHKVIKDNIDRAPLYNGSINGVGARYCPSIEDKVMRFSDKERHQLFLEPESASTNEWYLQGFGTSLPCDVQRKTIQTMKGLENAFLMRDGYAIEYDCIDSTRLLPTLESKDIDGLFFAGQINGTSGYEEAGAQGLIAGINASMKMQGKEPLILKRSESYIGVLIDDLVTKGTNEPYRMMTSRAEFRLQLRQDNCDLRLTEYGRKIGLVGDEQYSIYLTKVENIRKAKELLKTILKPNDEINDYLKSVDESPITTGTSIEHLLKRANVDIKGINNLLHIFDEFPQNVLDDISIETKYEGYLKRQLQQIEQQNKAENQKLSPDLDYLAIEGLRIEARQKLDKIKPLTIGQASRISGVNPADISVLLVYLKKISTN